MLQFSTYSFCATFYATLFMLPSLQIIIYLFCFWKMLVIFVWPRTRKLILLCCWQHHASIMLVVLCLWEYSLVVFVMLVVPLNGYLEDSFSFCCLLMFTWTGLFLTNVLGHVHLVTELGWQKHNGNIGTAVWGWQCGEGIVSTAVHMWMQWFLFISFWYALWKFLTAFILKFWYI